VRIRLEGTTCENGIGTRAANKNTRDLERLTKDHFFLNTQEFVSGAMSFVLNDKHPVSVFL
jgi:hypothetical protein